MKNTDALEAFVKENLNDSETVLWTGKPAGIKLLEAPYGSPIIVRWIICLVFAVVAIWYGLIYVPGNDNINTNGGIIMLVVLVIVAFIAVRPLMEVFRLNSKCFYYITNQRALILIKGNTDIVKEKSLADAPEISLDTISEGVGNVYIGNKTDNAYKRARFSVTSPQQDEEDLKKPLVFYSVANPDEVISYFPARNNSD